MKPSMTRYPAALAAAALAAALLLLGGGARAISTGEIMDDGTKKKVQGVVRETTPPQTVIAVSPETTVFQFRVPVRDSKGGTHINTITDVGTTVVVEKQFHLERNRPHHDSSSASIGAWYWYHNSNTDRFSIYGKYFSNSRVGGQLSIGGDTHLGLFEYYALFLYNAKNATKASPVGIQLGVGPYLSRRSGRTDTFSGGDPGVTGVADLTYTPGGGGRVSYTGEVWYVNYKAPARDLGLATTDSLMRFYAGLNYKI